MIERSESGSKVSWAEIRSDDRAGRDAELKKKMDFDARYEAEQVAKEAADREALREGELQARKERKALEMEKLRVIAAAHERDEGLNDKRATQNNDFNAGAIDQRVKSSQNFYDAVASVGNETSGACVGSKRSASLEDQPSQRSKRVKFAEVPTLECEESAGLDISEVGKDSVSELEGLRPGGKSSLESDSLEDGEEMRVSELEVVVEESPDKRLKALEEELADSRAVNGKFSKLLGDAKGEVATSKLKFEDLAGKHATLKSQFEHLAGKHAKEQEACRSLVGQLRAANSHLTKLQEENQTLRKQKSDSEALESKLKRRCTELQDKLMDYGSEVAEVKSKYQNQKELASRLKEQNIRQKDILRQNGIEVPKN